MRRLNTKADLVMDASDIPTRIIVTEGTRADCKEGCTLIDELSVEMLLSDSGMKQMIKSLKTL
ncbi:MAG: hypothetical protein DESF_01309 [Desulfovibrio sp.]